MDPKKSLSFLEEEERRARTRLAAYSASVYRQVASPMAADRRLRELERRWWGAASRLRHAKMHAEVARGYSAILHAHDPKAHDESVPRSDANVPAEIAEP